jgi:restriction system protein
MDLTLPDEILDILHKDGPQTEIDYRAAWARTHLKLIGAVDNTSRGVWTITDKGRSIQSPGQARERVRNIRADAYRARKAKLRQPEIEKRYLDEKKLESKQPDKDDDDDWTSALLGILKSMVPGAFERLCQRVLRESGFTRVEVTGRSGDGGIDGAGVLRVNLISFHVRFQCKRYAGSVGAREIRDFRGAMVGRADKGLFITTGAFTRDAQREAVRDGAPAIDLIDGTELCNLLKDLQLGVSTTTVQQIQPEPRFFGAL